MILTQRPTYLAYCAILQLRGVIRHNGNPVPYILTHPVGWQTNSLVRLLPHNITMVRLSQAVLSIFSLSTWSHGPTNTPHDPAHVSGLPNFKSSVDVHSKSIAIVGAGSAGIAVLKTILDLPEDSRSNWRIVLFEQRRDVGGVWLPDAAEPHPPALPETPLYPLLHTNTPHPTMTYPGFPFPPNTPLFPSHQYVEKYHVDVAEQLNLTQYIQLDSEVYAAGWRGNSTHGKWEVEVHRSGDDARVQRDSFDHLIVANGHNHYPRVPHFNGTDDWTANSPVGGSKRELLHSIFYRSPEHYTNKTVVVVGGGASGRDAASQVVVTARKVSIHPNRAITVLDVYVHPQTYNSLKPNSSRVPQDPVHGIEIVAPISHFTKDSIVLEDNTILTDVDAVVLATGYQFLVPFLSRSPSPDIPIALTVSPSTNYTSDTAPSLQTNTRYIYPLHEHIFSLSPTYPPTALSFIGLPVLIANCPSDIAQSLLVSHALADSNVLPNRPDMVSGLLRQEDGLRERGFDPYVAGHKMVGGDEDAQAYQDRLVRYLKQQGTIPDDGKDYVEQWRRDARNGSFLLKRAWTRIEEAGEVEVRRWLDGVETEDQWADLLSRLAEWQKKWEDEHSVLIERGYSGYWEADY